MEHFTQPKMVLKDWSKTTDLQYALSRRGTTQQRQTIAAMIVRNINAPPHTAPTSNGRCSLGMRQLPHFQPPGEDAAGDAVPLSCNKGPLSWGNYFSLLSTLLHNSSHCKTPIDMGLFSGVLQLHRLYSIKRQGDFQ
jgi:hypothetical protein